MLGMGNRFLSDDGAGPCIIAGLRDLDLPPCVTLDETCLSGINITKKLAGHDHAIVVDALRSGREPGTIVWLAPHNPDPQSSPCSEHSSGIFRALALGKDLGQNMPVHVVVLAKEAADVHTFLKNLTCHVRSAIPHAVDHIARKLAQMTGSDCAA